jgi:uncharacterized membrane protein YgcG
VIVAAAAPSAHVVAYGDSTSSIAARSGVSIASLVAANPHKPTIVAVVGGARRRVFATLGVGEVLRLPPAFGLGEVDLTYKACNGKGSIPEDYFDNPSSDGYGKAGWCGDPDCLLCVEGPLRPGGQRCTTPSGAAGETTELLENGAGTGQFICTFLAYGWEQKTASGEPCLMDTNANCVSKQQWSETGGIAQATLDAALGKSPPATADSSTSSGGASTDGGGSGGGGASTGGASTGGASTSSGGASTGSGSTAGSPAADTEKKTNYLPYIAIAAVALVGGSILFASSRE